MDSTTIATQPDTYAPIVNSEGNYVDKIPSQSAFTVSGLKCPCSIKKDQVYWTRAQFSSHVKTKTHQNWLCELSLSNMNYYSRVQDMEKMIKEQKIMIAKLERDVRNRDITIFTLTQQISQLSMQMSNNMDDLMQTHNNSIYSNE